MKTLTRSQLIIHTVPTGHLGNGGFTNQKQNIMKNDNQEFLSVPGQVFVQVDDESDLPIVINNGEVSDEEVLLPQAGYDIQNRVYADETEEAPMGITGIELK